MGSLIGRLSCLCLKKDVTKLILLRLRHKTMPRVLVACEFSGIVREAFAAQGFDVTSCDLLPTELPCSRNAAHIVGNVLELLIPWTWDLLIAFPPCTHLASSGARWFKEKAQEQRDAVTFVKALAEAPIEKIAIENPIGVLSTLWRKPDQIIQPWQFGHGETKATCLWTKNLPQLSPTEIVTGREARVHREPPSKDRWKNRSRTYEGIAKAMATQWGASLHVLH